ncbi:unnamed protein product, partial [Adineta steineri]
VLKLHSSAPSHSELQSSGGADSKLESSGAAASKLPSSGGADSRLIFFYCFNQYMMFRYTPCGVT